ncbi:4-hydroxy-tetrahydrodipicolinate synthase [Blattabacterium cuenoti]|uniref:4-hydroxy-tetrahydrodipicolinate synthase n=1 Tax=Blattabacterium cuenoti TaxID=1653831 RepID=UPI00163D2EF1|nr:4-hydroxy-tetrahydrodipicolinate synthase [Blattabacterium cuenoti]
MKKFFGGTGVALVTPFKKNKEVDFDGIINLVKYVKEKVDYLVILGTTSEYPTLNKKEQEEIINCIKKINNKKLPLVLGIGGNNTKDIVKKINNFDLSEFIAILSVSPYYNNPTQEGIYQHFKYISMHTNNNIIIYNVPKRTGVNVHPQTVIRLARDYKNIIGIKEASGCILQSYQIIAQKPKNFYVISGDDFITLPIILGGGDGVISVIAQGLPKAVSKMVSLVINHQVKEAFYIYYNILDIIKYLYEEGNPVGIKTLLSIIGICHNYVRLPLLHGTTTLITKMKKCLENINQFL